MPVPAAPSAIAGLATAWRDVPGNVRGSALLIGAWVFFTAEIVSVKLLATHLPVAEIVLFRVASQLLMLTPYVVRNGTGAFRTRHFPMHLLRSASTICGMSGFYFAFATLPLALATTFSFTKAFFVIALAALLLGERVGWRRWSATAVGFLGVLVVMRPGFTVFEWAMLAALGGSLAGSVVYLSTKRLSATEPTATIMLYVGLLTTLGMVGPALAVWVPPLSTDWGLIALVCGAGFIGQFMVIRALTAAEASALAPVDYVRLVFAGIAGFLVFGEVPDAWTLGGSSIIVFSTLYITRREAQLARQGRVTTRQGPPSAVP